MIMIILAPQPSVLFLPATNAGWVNFISKDLKITFHKTIIKAEPQKCALTVDS